MNIIMPFGGYDLFNLKSNIDKIYKQYKAKKNYQNIHFINTYKGLSTNFKMYFKHLVVGLYKLHKSRIVNCDIKNENIMANYNNKTKKIDIRFIDFGFSEHLTPEYCNHYSNLKLFGTELLLSPEIFITVNIYKELYKKNGNIKTIVHKIKNNIDENVKDILKFLNQTEYVKMLYYPYEDKTTHIKQLPIIEKLYNEIINYFNNKTILNVYFGTNKIDSLNGYLQKADVYALGCSMYEFLITGFKIIDVNTNLKLHNLLKNMIHPDPNKRYNILECLKHPYFQ